ncbi:5'-3' exonuclease [Streptomyces sp. ST2-7A]|uniref:5'-3' exonuclease n=1 Tax=Streptomyces sp. ST2-7A TaxID=2907214 RepID=UPI001F38B61A|nr:5'-3' exonuclease [Streptomyces sp. ST2-7A]MCE7082605.1 5'-3' exonuclease [Streptomyces sp. ST2-7A]
MLLDTSSLYYRAYFGVPESVRAPDGTPVNAVRGLLDFIARLMADHRPSGLVACLDTAWRPTWRVRLIPSYKAHRVAEGTGVGTGAGGTTGNAAGEAEEAPDSLLAQVPIIHEVLDALGIARLGATDHEADDVIGTLARRADRPVLVVTGDRDLFQLVDDAREARVLYPRKGVGDCDVVTEEVVRERYGVPASRYTDFAVLRGDPSDGLPGVRGIGDKTAAQLLVEYGDLAGVRAAADDPATRLTPARRRNLLAAADYLDVAPRVVRVVDDLPLPAIDPTPPTAPADPTALSELADRWGLGGSLRRVVETLAAQSPR